MKLNFREKLPDDEHLPLGSPEFARETGALLIEGYWTKNADATKNFSIEIVHKQADLLSQEVEKVALSENPRMANRERLAESVLVWAQFQVLLIPPPPADDLSGLRGKAGITGEMGRSLLDLAHLDGGLKDFYREFGIQPKSHEEAWDPVVLRYHVAHAWVHVFQGLRGVYGDTGPKGRDWFRPLTAAVCAEKELHYRELLGMPSSLVPARSELPDHRPIAISMFLNCVVNGHADPFEEWNSMMCEIEGGDNAWRDGSWLAWPQP